MKKSIEESDNPLTNTGRAVSGRLTNMIGKWSLSSSSLDTICMYVYER